jgi:hypothetical protein
LDSSDDFDGPWPEAMLPWILRFREPRTTELEKAIDREILGSKRRRSIEITAEKGNAH